MSFPKYPTYKDTGIEWLEQIPEAWGEYSLRSLAGPGKDAFVDGDWIEAPYITDEGVRLIQTGNVGVGRYKEQGYRFISSETFRELGCTNVSPGDVLICRLAEPVGRACQAPDLGSQMITSVDVCILKPRDGLDRRFVVFLLSSAEYLGYMEGQCRGGTRDRVSRSFLGRVRVPIPVQEEQEAIASFLDRETAKIDDLIAEQKRLIDLLREKRQAVISHAVTKGLNRDAPMKASGVEWMGQVPAHWDIMSLASATEDRCDGPFGSGLKSEHYTEAGVRVIRLQNIKRDGFNHGDAAFIDPKYCAESLGGHDVIAGDLLLAGLGDDNHTVGRACVVPIGIEPAIVKADCFRFRLRTERAVPEFLAYQLCSGAEADAGVLSTGTTRSRIPLSVMARRKVALPDTVEQAGVVAFIRGEKARLDDLLEEAQRGIDLLEERRTALISAAVTGQIDVRALAHQSAA